MDDEIDFQEFETQVEAALNEMNENEKEVNFSTLGHNVTPDSGQNIYLYYEDHCIATSGIDFGLDEYYYTDLEQTPELKESPYKEAIEHSKNKWIITQMQAVKGTGKIRKDINYRKTLMSAWNRLEDKLDIYIGLYLPGKLNYWIVPSIEFSYIHFKPQKSGLRQNYDSNARIHDFELNEAGLFER